VDWLLDTGVAILLRDARDRAPNHIEVFGSLPGLSIVTQVELEGGVYAQPEYTARRRAGLDALLAVFPVIPFDAPCAAAYRRIVESRGFVRRTVADRMIAATALVHGCGVVTTNAVDFANIPGLDVRPWPQTG
jgi:predicted nucleic acid-binding protein